MQCGCWKDASPCKMRGCSTIPVHQPWPVRRHRYPPHPPRICPNGSRDRAQHTPDRPAALHTPAWAFSNRQPLSRAGAEGPRTPLAVPAALSLALQTLLSPEFGFFFPGRLLTSRQSTTSGWRAANLPAALAQTRCHQHFAAAASSAALRVFPCSLNAHTPPPPPPHSGSVLLAPACWGWKVSPSRIQI